MFFVLLVLAITSTEYKIKIKCINLYLGSTSRRAPGTPGGGAPARPIATPPSLPRTPDSMHGSCLGDASSGPLGSLHSLHDVSNTRPSSKVTWSSI